MPAINQEWPIQGATAGTLGDRNDVVELKDLEDTPDIDDLSREFYSDRIVDLVEMEGQRREQQPEDKGRGGGKRPLNFTISNKTIVHCLMRQIELF